jgi:hypothetical protein
MKYEVCKTMGCKGDAAKEGYCMDCYCELKALKYI